jgi:hypothetical protein
MDAGVVKAFSQCRGLILRDASLRDAPQDEVLLQRFAPPRDEVLLQRFAPPQELDPHGEERGNAARLEP